jgi:predicted dehydrogenase
MVGRQRMSEIGVGLVGYRFMGRVHSNAYRQVARFFAVDPAPRMRAICGRDEEAVRSVAGALGWEGYETDYARLLERDDVQLVDISSSGDTHHGFALAALEAGKHVLCEKPLANTLTEAREMVEAARKAGTVSMVCHNYRRVPAVQLARRIIEEGRLGEIRHWRAVYLQDWLLDPEAPMTWRLRKETGGAGPLADLGSHLVDLAHFLVGPIAEVIGTAETFIKERPLEGTDCANPEMARVTVNDAAAFLARFENGVIGTFETSPMIPGRKAKESFEINGSKGSLIFDLERMNELRVYFEDEGPETAGFRTVLVTEPEHPYMEGWWPPGHVIGYEHTFVHTVKDLLDGIKTGNGPGPTFEDGYRCQAVIDAVERSVESREWTTPEIERTKGGVHGEV